MTPTTCETCRERPATQHDYAMRAGRWVQVDLCETCARNRRLAAMRPLIGAASAAALLGGLAFAFERYARAQEEHGETPPPATGPLEWTRRLRGATPTLAAYSRDLTAEARAGRLDPVVGRE